MEIDELLAVVDDEGAALAAAARPMLDAEVPACPGWCVADLVAHTASVYRRTTHILASRCTDRPRGRDWYEEAPAGDAVVEWFAGAHADLVAQLRAVDPGTQVWTFSPDHGHAGFWHRRMAHETVVHRFDVEDAIGAPAPGPVRPRVAVDGIDELLDVLVVPRVDADPTRPASTVHLHATDLTGEWLLRVGPAGIAVERGHAKGDAAARGPASDLLLWLWGRRALDDGIECFGDRPVLDRLRQTLAAAL